MFRHYLKMAWRNLTRDRAYTALNVFVLVIGMASFLLIGLYIKDELSFDRFHENGDRVFRVWTELSADGPGERSASMSFPVARALKEQYPEYVEESVRFFNMQAPFITLGKDSLRNNESNVYFTDPSVFKIFTFEFIKGEAETALADSTCIVLTRELAIKYFGTIDVLGESMFAESGMPLTVSAVIEDVPSSTHIPINALISMRALNRLFSSSLTESNWVWNPCWTYVLLKDGSCAQDLEAELPVFIERNYPDLMRNRVKAHLMPLQDIHLNSHLQYEIKANSYVENVRLFSIVGFFILVVACINYTNLATSRATRMTREVGVSKVLGASRKELILRFLGESIILSVISIFVSLVLVELSLPLFNELTNKSLISASMFEPITIFMILALAIGVGVVAGMYPAWILSATSPTVILRNSRKGSGGARVRKALVFVQFCVALGLIMGTTVVNRQFDFLQNQDIGFNEEGLLITPVKWEAAKYYPSMREKMMADPSILGMTRMNEVVGLKHNMHEYNHSKLDSNDYTYFASLIVDEHFVSTIGLDIVAGRDLTKEDDHLKGVLVNETLVEQMNWGTPENALGKPFSTPEGEERVVGVIKDFHFVSLSEEIQPFALDVVKGPAEVFFTRYFCFRVARGQEERAEALIAAAWEEYQPRTPLDAFYLEDAMDQAYESQNTLRILMLVFSLVAVAIACLGLFALSAFTAEQKTRELSIRKIIGANDRQLFKVVAIDFIRMALWGILITAPITYAVLYQWLNSFAYHVELNWLNFITISLFGGSLALFAVVFQAWKASKLDPIAALRYE